MAASRQACRPASLLPSTGLARHLSPLLFADVLDCLSTSSEPIVLVGDVNIRVERATNQHAGEFCELIAGYGLSQRICGPTHDAGGTLDVVCTRDDLPSPTVDVIDIGLSDHRLLCWSSSCLLYTSDAADE